MATSVLARPTRRQVAVSLVAITAVGASLRLWMIDAVPVGLFFDVAANLFDVLEIRDGHWPIWFPRNNGREPMMLYAEALVSLVTGPNILAAKLAAAAFGIVSIPAFYLLGRELSGHVGDMRARRVGLIAAAIGAFLFWHVHFSRIGLRAITLPLFLALGLALAARATRRSSTVLAALSGLAFGLSLYTYTAARLTPLVVAAAFGIPLVGAAAIARRTTARRTTAGLAAYASVALPLLIYYIRNPDLVGGRASAVSILNPDVSRGDPFGASIDGFTLTLGSIVSTGTRSAMENIPGRPLLDPIIAAACLIGIIVIATRLVRRDWRSAMLPWTLLVMALPSALAVNPPGFSRVSGMIPPLIAIAAIGLDRATDRIGPLALVAALVGSLAFTSHDYFVRWAPSDDAFRAMMEDKVQGARQIGEWRAAGDRVFLAPLYARDYTFQFLLRDTGVESFDVGASTVIPAGPTVTRYAFPPEDAAGVATVARRLSAPYERSWVSDKTGRRPLLAVLTAKGPASWPDFRARLADGIDLGAAQFAGSVPRGANLQVELTWRARARPTGAYTAFVHFRDGDDRTRFQGDRIPGAGSVPTNRWAPRDTIVDAIDIAVPPEVPLGAYRVVVGLYDPGTGQRVRIEEPTEGNELSIGTVRVDQ